MNPSDEDLKRIYATARTIAVVGISSNEAKPAHTVPAFLQEAGYSIVPVTPSSEQVLGEPAVASLREVEGDVDVVDVFRPAEEAPGIANEAVAIGAKVLWLQEGIVSEDAAEIARAGGLTVVMDACIKKTYERLGLARQA